MEKSTGDIIKELAEGRVVEDIISNMKVCVGEVRENLEDLAQDIYVDLMEKDSEVIEGLYKRGEIKFYISKMIINNVHSKSSPYYVRYKKFLIEELDDKYDEIDGGI